MFTQNLVSFIIDGEKEIFHSDVPIVLRNKIAVIKKTNCLMTETKINSDNKYKALLVFFDNDILTNFKIKYHHLLDNLNKTKTAPISVIDNDRILIGYRNNLVNTIKNHHQVLTKEIKQLKFEELFLYLLQTYPHKINPILHQNNDAVVVNFKTIIENNSIANLSISELAFLCNMSESTFKRHFFKHYHTSPQKWFLNKRMEHAKSLIGKGKKPTEIFSSVGYSTLSNFLKAFKKYSEEKKELTF
ncbi:MAG TPA: AraC family transcriptional regulator [Arcobacter sp.]|nr:AraC family transcriptional regulator [Arcobacter sp.]